MMSDEQKNQDETPLADEDLDEVAGGKILNRANPTSTEYGTQWAPPPELPDDAAQSGGGIPGTFGNDNI